VNDELVNHVQNCGDKENRSDVLPSLFQQFAPVGRVPENCSEERPSILMCIPQPFDGDRSVGPSPLEAPVNEERTAKS